MWHSFVRPSSGDTGEARNSFSIWQKRFKCDAVGKEEKGGCLTEQLLWTVVGWLSPRSLCSLGHKYCDGSDWHDLASTADI